MVREAALESRFLHGREQGKCAGGAVGGEVAQRGVERLVAVVGGGPGDERAGDFDDLLRRHGGEDLLGLIRVARGGEQKGDAFLAAGLVRPA